MQDAATIILTSSSVYRVEVVQWSKARGRPSPPEIDETIIEESGANHVWSSEWLHYLQLPPTAPALPLPLLSFISRVALMAVVAGWDLWDLAWRAVLTVVIVIIRR